MLPNLMSFRSATVDGFGRQSQEEVSRRICSASSWLNIEFYRCGIYLCSVVCSAEFCVVQQSDLVKCVSLSSSVCVNECVSKQAMVRTIAIAVANQLTYSIGVG